MRQQCRVTKTEYLIRELRSNFWVKPAIMGLAAVIWVSSAYFLAEYLPDKLKITIERGILLNLLGIMASTMLTVATFSVAAMVSAFSAVATTATPRATRIVMGDKSTQNSLTSFLAAFIYAIIALVAISTVPYGAGGRILLFAGYCVMVFWVLFSFVRWVDRVSKLGRMGDTLERVEEACQEAFASPSAMTTLGGKAAKGDPPEGRRISSETVGYVQNIDMEALNDIAGKLGLTARVLERPGSFVDPHDALVLLPGDPEIDDDTVSEIRKTFHVGDSRRVGSDPRFGLIVLSEIADRALSPAVNDPGTAIAVLGIMVRLMETWGTHDSAESRVRYENVEVSPLDPEDLMDDAFTAISRDGAPMFEVGARIQKSLSVLARLGNGKLATAAKRHSDLALEQAGPALVTANHKDLIRKLAAKVGASGD